MRSIFRLRTAIAAAILLAAADGVHAATVTSIYELNGSFEDSLGNAPDLVPAGGTLGATSYAFDRNEGLALSGGLASDSDYSIEMRFSFSTLSGFRKIVDFKDRASDTGFYNLSTALNFFPVVTGPAGALTADVLADVVLTRDGGTDLVSAYADGTLEFSFTDSGDLAVFTGPSDIIHFFKDDLATLGSEASAGVVDRIRIYSGALIASEVAALAAGGDPPGLPPPGGQVPEPGTLALLGSGVATLLAISRSRRRR